MEDHGRVASRALLGMDMGLCMRIKLVAGPKLRAIFLIEREREIYIYIYTYIHAYIYVYSIL